MKKIALIIFFIIGFLAKNIVAQGTDCATATPFCTAVPASLSAQQNTTAPTGPNYGCLISQPNPAWFYLQISTSGPITLSMTNSANVDIDYIIWGPFTSASAACASGLTSAAVSCSYSISPTETGTIPSGVIGEVYVLLITNFSNQPTTISLAQTGGIGATDCSIVNVCNITTLTAVPGACNSPANTYDLSGTVTYINPPSTGTLTVTNSCSGATQVFNAPFNASSASYTLLGLPSNGTGCTVSAVFSNDTTCTFTQNFTAPSACFCPITVDSAGTCNGTPVTLTANGAASYLWSTGETTAAILASGIPAVYTVIGTTGTCSDTATSLVTVFPPPTVTAGSSGNLNCSIASVILTGSSIGNTMVWNGGVLTNAPDPATVTAAGTYTVTATDPSNGCTNTASVTITASGTLTASITGYTVSSCNGVCDGVATALGTGGTPGAGYSYSWNTVPNQNTAIATGLCASTYICTITDANNCTDTTTVTISEPPPVVIAPIADAIICSGGNTTLSASASGGNNGGYSYSWDAPGNTGFSATASILVSPVSTTTYTVNAGDVGHNCPAVPVMVTVIVNPPLAVAASGGTSACLGDPIPLTAAATGGGGGTYTYSWVPTTGLNLTTGANVIATPTVTTTYTVTAIDNCGVPTATDTVTAIILPLPVVVFSVDVNAGCAPLCVNFSDASIVSGGTIAAWNWGFGDGLSSVAQNPSHCFGSQGQFSVTSTVISDNGCISTDTNNFMVTVFPNPVAAFNPVPNPASVIDPGVTMNNQSSSDVDHWFWSFGDGDSLVSAASSPTHTYPNDTPGNYIATLMVQNANGCYDTVTHQIFIGPEFAFFIPNAFSPNGDNINEYFSGSGTGISEFNLWIFDRWGNMIFHGKDVNDKWNGKANAGSETAQEDVYFWKVKLMDVFDKPHSYIGTVTILK